MKETEHLEQCALFELASKYPKFQLLNASANGGKRNINVAKKLKRSGVKAGYPDVFLPVSRLGYHGLFIEMKASKPRGVLKPHQKAWLKALSKEGYLCFTCWGAEAAWTVLNNYINSKLTLKGKDWKKIT